MRATIPGRITVFFLALTVSWLGSCGEERDAAVVQLDLGKTIRDLGSDDLDVASNAASRLAAIGSPAIPGLAAALRQEPEAVRVGVIEVLQDIGGEEVVPLLAGAVGDPSPAVRADAVFALRGYRGAAVEPAVLRGLGDADANVRQRAATACGSVCRSPDAVRVIVERALDDPAAPAGWSAVAALVRILRPSEQKSPLAETVESAISASAPARLGGPDAASRVRAAVLLAIVGDERGAPVLQAAAVDSRDPRVRLWTVYGLGFIAGSDSIPVLRALLSGPGTGAYAYDALRRAAKRGVTGADAALAGYAGPAPGSLPPPVW